MRSWDPNLKTYRITDTQDFARFENQTKCLPLSNRSIQEPASQLPPTTRTTARGGPSMDVQVRALLDQKPRNLDVALLIRPDQRRISAPAEVCLLASRTPHRPELRTAHPALPPDSTSHAASRRRARARLQQEDHGRGRLLNDSYNSVIQYCTHQLA